jgi:pantoate--beta-alanine ligase
MVGDLNLGMEVAMVPTVRDQAGLALSSRNRYLSASEREQALAISQGLRCVADRVAWGDTNVARLTEALQHTIQDGGIRKIDYAAIVDAETLADLDVLDRPAVALVAAHVGTTRLIDNQLLIRNS